MSRSVVKEVLVDVPPDVVWCALTEAEQLTRWFPVDAHVEPGLGGSIWLSWGGGVEGQAPITAWEPNRHLQWTETRGARQGRHRLSCRGARRQNAGARRPVRIWRRPGLSAPRV